MFSVDPQDDETIHQMTTDITIEDDDRFLDSRHQDKIQQSSQIKKSIRHTWRAPASSANSAHLMLQDKLYILSLILLKILNIIMNYYIW